MDYQAAGLLGELEGSERDARIRLLDKLIEAGFEPEELKRAVHEDRLALLPVEHTMAGEYSAAELANKSGLPVETLLGIRRSLGLPEVDKDAKVFAEADIEAASSIKSYLDAGFSEESVTEITRVLGEGMARLSAASGQLFAQTFLRPGESEDEMAWRFARLAENMTDSMEPVLAAAFRAHVLDSARRAMLSQADLAAGRVAGEQELTVCFADLVGFTRLGAELETQLLGDVVGRFAELAAQAAEPPVRLVKTIGDAAMLVSRDPKPLVQAALWLVEAIEEADLPAVRAGVACGPVIQRSGDLYGHAVNLASRVTGIARPGSVLCTKEVHDATPDFDWSFAGRHRLKGLGDAVPLYRARRPEAAKAEVRKPSAGRRRR